MAAKRRRGRKKEGGFLRLLRFLAATVLVEVAVGEFQEDGPVGGVEVAAGVVAEGEVAGDKRDVGVGHLIGAEAFRAEEFVDRAGRRRL